MQFFKDLRLSAFTAGFVAVLVGFTSSIAIVFQAAQSFGATPEIMAASFGVSRSFSSRQAAPMQKRDAPPALAAMASARTAVVSISFSAFRPVSKLADCEQ